MLILLGAGCRNVSNRSGSISFRRAASNFEKVSKSVEVGFAGLLEGATTELRLAQFAVQVDLASEKSSPGKQKGLGCLSYFAGRTDTLVLSIQESIMTGYRFQEQRVCL